MYNKVKKQISRLEVTSIDPVILMSIYHMHCLLVEISASIE